ncbi:MAG: hypothetical protein WA825_13910 [Steroidobacteraceae bacterium]
MKIRPAWAALWIAAVVTATIAQAAPNPGAGASQDLDPNLVRKITPGQSACLGDGTGYVRARIRGALNMDLRWKDAQLACAGDARPDGSGLRVSFAGPGPGGKVLRLVFGISSAHEGKPGRELPTNLTVLLDGGRIFATQGDDKCTMDQLSQRPLPATPGLRAWRIEARGFCVTPANALDGKGRIFVSRFDFAGRLEFSGRG